MKSCVSHLVDEHTQVDEHTGEEMVEKDMMEEDMVEEDMVE